MREIAHHTQRIQKPLDVAILKMTGVVSNVLGVSGRAILGAHCVADRSQLVKRLGDLGNDVQLAEVAA